MQTTSCEKIMKKTNPILSSTVLSLILFLVSLPQRGSGDSAVPILINYQAFVTDINGSALANTEPENFDVIFRFYDSAQGGSSLYTETQTVTIFQGNLNTLLGQGLILDINPADSNPDEPKPDLDSIFNGDERFLGITIDENHDGFGDDGEISPRQQIVANPFAFRAKLAERAHTLESPDGSATDAVSIDGTGRVGIGDGDPLAPLHVFGESRFGTSYGQRLGQHGSAANNFLFGHFGFNMGWDGSNWSSSNDGSNNGAGLIASAANGDLRFFTFPTTGSTDQSISDGNLNDNLRLFIDKFGNVGVGTVSPAGLFHVSSGTSGDAEFVLEADTDDSNELDSPQIKFLQDGGVTSAMIGLEGTGGTTVSGSTSNSTLVGAVSANKDVHIITDNTVRFTVEGGSGFVGIGNNNPGRPLSITPASGSTQWIELRNNGDETKWHINHIAGGLNFAESGPTGLDGRLFLQPGGNAGINTANPESELHVVGSHSGDGADPANNIAFFQNTSSGGSADVLLLRVGASDPGGGANFITFRDSSSDTLGSIQGDGSGGVTLAAAGNDYAEYLPRMDPDEILSPGDVVGTFGGKITSKTAGAELIMVISTAPIVLGNDPGEGRNAAYEKVVFMGQAPVRVRGPVEVGDFLLPSGQNDGTAIAVAGDSMDIQSLGKVIGRAWEASRETDVKRIKTVIGLNVSASAIAEGMTGQMETLRNENRSLRYELRKTQGLYAQIQLRVRETETALARLEDFLAMRMNREESEATLAEE